MHSPVRRHPLLRSLHAGVELHRREHERHTTQHSSSIDHAESQPTGSASIPAASASSCCARCSAAAAATAMASSDLHALYAIAVSSLEPFETLSPNLSQLAFTRHQPTHKATTTADESRSTQSFIDADGCLIWTSCSDERIRQWNATASTSMPSSSHSTNVYTASSAFVTMACAAVSPYVASLSTADFERRYGRYFAMSHHASMICEQFTLHQSGRLMSDPGSPHLTAAVSFMVLSTHIERLIGDVFCALRSSQATVCPRMLRDLFLTRELGEFLPPECMFLLQSLCGSPQSFNIRNILWHGFLSGTCAETDSALRQYTDMLWLVWMGLLRECERIWGERSARIVAPSAAMLANSSDSSASVGSEAASSPLLPFRRPLKARFPGDSVLHDHLSSELFAVSGSDSTVPFSCWAITPADVFHASDDVFASTMHEFDRLISASYLIPHHRVHDVLASLRLLRTNVHSAMVLLLPALEQIMRHYFVYCNATLPGSGGVEDDQAAHPHVVAGLLLAQSEQLFTTLDIIMANKVEPIEEAGESSAVSSSSSTKAPLQKCSRTSAFAFPLVPSSCSFHPGAWQRNQIYQSSHGVLPHLMPHGVLFAIYDLLLSRVGPRLRDRLAHGEIRWKDDDTLPPWIAVWTINVVLGLAVEFPILQPSGGEAPLLVVPTVFSSEMASSARACFSRYQPVTHARSLFMQQMIVTAQGIQLLAREVREEEATEQPPADDILRPTLSLSAPVLHWYRFTMTESLARVLTHGVQLFAGQGNNLPMSVQSNALAVRCGALVRQMKEHEPAMPLWTMLARWMLDPTASASVTASSTLRWHELSLESFWSRAHTLFHHGRSADSSCEDCSTACQLQCFDECMTHAPVVALQRILDRLSSIPRSIEAALLTLRTAVAAADAPSGKRKLVVEVEAALPAILLCCATTLVSIALLWEQLMRKAHGAVPATSSSESDLLKVDRSIARLLKKAGSGLDRLHSQYQRNCWLLALEDWTEVVDGMEKWRERSQKIG
jgi:hypothetical protein